MFTSLIIDWMLPLPIRKESLCVRWLLSFSDYLYGYLFILFFHILACGQLSGFILRLLSLLPVYQTKTFHHRVLNLQAHGVMPTVAVHIGARWHYSAALCSKAVCAGQELA